MKNQSKVRVVEVQGTELFANASIHPVKVLFYATMHFFSADPAILSSYRCRKAGLRYPLYLCSLMVSVMMKKIAHTVLIFALLAIASCNQGTPGLITITLNIKDMPGTIEKAYLQELQPATTLMVDTASVDHLKSNFSFSFVPNGSESLYRIHFDDSTNFLLVLKDADVQISGNYHHPEQWNIQGSPASEELQRFLGQLNAGNRALHQAVNTYDQLKEARAPDSLLQAHDQMVKQHEKAILDTILQEAQTTKSPVNAVFALSILDDSASWQQGKAAFEALAQRFPQNELVKNAVAAYHKKMNDQGESMKPGIGDLAPDLRFPDTSGKVFSLYSLKGKYVLVDFWASWCAPCREANPELVKAWDRFKGRNFTILGVSLDSKKTSWEKAIEQDKLSWHQVSDLKGWNSAPAAMYGVEAIPANFLLDPEGKIIAVNIESDSLILHLRQVLPPRQ